MNDIHLLYLYYTGSFNVGSKALLSEMQTAIHKDDLPKLELDDKKEEINPQSRCHSTQNLSMQKKQKHPFSNRFGSVADMMKQFYRAKYAYHL